MRKRSVSVPTAAIVAAVLFTVPGLLWMADVWGRKVSEEPCALQSPFEWFGCVVGKHGDLAGGLIGAAGTIIAGIFAWRAAMKAIDANRAREFGAFEVATRRIREIAECFNQVWRVVDITLEGDDLNSGAMLIFALLPSERVLDDRAQQLEALAREFDPKRQVDLKDLAAAIRTARNLIPEIRRPEIDKPWLRSLHNTLNYFKYCCEKFDPAGPDYFRGRNWSPLDELGDQERDVLLVNMFVEKRIKR